MVLSIYFWDLSVRVYMKEPWTRPNGFSDKAKAKDINTAPTVQGPPKED